MKNKILDELVEKHSGFAIAAREHIHRNPELGNEEFETSAFIQKSLAAAGIEYYAVPDMTGVVGIIRGKEGGKTIALRADMDALPIQEESDKPYRSQKAGVMHACGHDAHTAILLGAAAALQDARQYLQGNVKLFFQPAEETCGGAKRMIAAGCMEDPSVDHVFGLHVDSTVPTGTVHSRFGAMNASSDAYDVTIYGQKAHGARPHLGNDAIVAAASIVLEIQSIISRRISAHDGAVITVGKINGGTARNIIADRVDLEITLRTLADEVREKIKGILPAMIEHICAMHEVKAKIVHEPGYDSLHNDKDCVELVKSVAQRLLGKDSFGYIENPSLGCEDFSYFCRAAPGAFYNLGCRNESLGIVANAHSSRFDVDPRAIAIGMKMQVGIVFELIGAALVKPR